MTYAKRVDRNHGEIIQALRACGWLVYDTSRLAGFCDLVAHKQGRTVLVEVKTAKGKPTKAQLALAMMGWPVRTVRTIWDAVNL